MESLKKEILEVSPKIINGNLPRWDHLYSFYLETHLSYFRRYDDPEYQEKLARMDSRERGPARDQPVS